LIGVGVRIHAINNIVLIIHDDNLRISSLSKGCDFFVDQFRADISVVSLQNIFKACLSLLVFNPEQVLHDGVVLCKSSTVPSIVVPVGPVVDIDVVVDVLQNVESVVSSDSQIDSAGSVSVLQVFNVCCTVLGELKCVS